MPIAVEYVASRGKKIAKMDVVPAEWQLTYRRLISVYAINKPIKEHPRHRGVFDRYGF